MFTLAEQAAKRLGIKPNELLDMLGLLKRDLSDKSDRPARIPDGCWFVETRTTTVPKFGYIDFDTVTHYIPKEVRLYMTKKTLLQVRMDPMLHKWFKKYCQQNDVTMSKAITAYLKQLRKRFDKEIEAEQI